MRGAICKNHKDGGREENLPTQRLKKTDGKLLAKFYSLTTQSLDRHVSPIVSRALQALCLTSLDWNYGGNRIADIQAITVAGDASIQAESDESSRGQHSRPDRSDN